MKQHRCFNFKVKDYHKPYKLGDSGSTVLDPSTPKVVVRVGSVFDVSCPLVTVSDVVGLSEIVDAKIYSILC